MGLASQSTPVRHEEVFLNDLSARSTASPRSHGRLAKDFQGNENHVRAVTVAALVVRQIGLMLKGAFARDAGAQFEGASSQLGRTG